MHCVVLRLFALIIVLAACKETTAPSFDVRVRLNAQRFSDNLGSGCQIQWRAAATDSATANPRPVSYVVESSVGPRSQMTGEFRGHQELYWDLRLFNGDQVRWTLTSGGWSAQHAWITATC